MNVVLGPFHDLQQLLPIVHLVEIQILHRSTGDDETVEIPSFDRLKCGIERFQVIFIRVLGLVAGGPQQFHLNLQRRVGQLAEQLRFRDDLSGHQL